MHTVHAGFSVSVPIADGKENAVKKLLNDLNADPGGNSLLPFGKMPTTHFVTGVVLPAQDAHGKTLPPTLMLLTSYTGPRKVHLDELVREGAAGLRALFSNCKGYPAAADSSDTALKAFLRKNRKPDTFYTGMQYITHRDIAQEEALRNAIEEFLDQHHQKLSALPGPTVRRQIQDFVKTRPEFKWTQTPWKRTFGDFWVLYRALIYFLLITVVLLLSPILWLIFKGPVLGALAITCGVLVTVAVLLILIFRLNEMRKHFLAGRQPDAKVKEILATQNHPVINEMTVAGPLKKGWIRTVFLFAALKVVVFLRGLAYIPTVATARWLLIDGGKRLVFISNFANLSEGYVRDFIDSRKRGSRINIIFGQGYGYPATRWILGDGAIDDPNGFMNVVYSMQQPTQFWYWPFKHLSVDNININRKIQLGLTGKQTNEETAEWLSLF